LISLGEGEAGKGGDQVLYKTNTQIGFHSSSSLKQQFAGRRMTTHYSDSDSTLKQQTPIL
jgi:hypothetical protein